MNDNSELNLSYERRGRMDRARRALLLLLPVIVLLCVGFWTLLRSVPRIYVESDSGVYDLTGVDLRHTMAELRRTVEYIPGELLTRRNLTRETISK